MKAKIFNDNKKYRKNIWLMPIKDFICYIFNYKYRFVPNQYY